jgi:hypothetical protein
MNSRVLPADLRNQFFGSIAAVVVHDQDFVVDPRRIEN